jgi:hypothetical protein
MWEAHSLCKILDTFMDASGMSINQLKSQVFFFNNPLAVQCHILRIMGFNERSLPSNYLGLPLINSGGSNALWERILSKLKNKLSSWTFHTLNHVGRLILLISILQSIPLYNFSTLAIPKHILQNMRALQRNFLCVGHTKWISTSWINLNCLLNIS